MRTGEVTEVDYSRESSNDATELYRWSDAVGGYSWMTSTVDSVWHLVPRHSETFLPYAECGHPIKGRVHRRLDEPTLNDGRHLCASCHAQMVGCPTIRTPRLDVALSVLPLPPIIWPGETRHAA